MIDTYIMILSTFYIINALLIYQKNVVFLIKFKIKSFK